MYATLFDKRYMSRGITMGLSLLRHCKSSQLTILCLDLESEIGVNSLLPSKNVNVLRVSNLDLKVINQIRDNRNYREYCWALSSLLCDYLLDQGTSEVVYLDADIYFLNDPSSILLEARGGDVAAIRHRFPNRLKHYEINGIYNVQWVYFKNTLEGRRILAQWVSQCIESSSYDPENGVVGDQKYLDEWPQICPTFTNIETPGAGVAPWNHEIYQPRYNGGRWETVDGNPLVFYHFHGLRIEPQKKIELAGPIYSQVQDLPIALYIEYLRALSNIEVKVNHLSDLPHPQEWEIAAQTWFQRLKRNSIQLSE